MRSLAWLVVLLLSCLGCGRAKSPTSRWAVPLTGAAAAAGGLWGRKHAPALGTGCFVPVVAWAMIAPHGAAQPQPPDLLAALLDSDDAIHPEVLRRASKQAAASSQTQAARWKQQMEADDERSVEARYGRTVRSFAP